MADTASEVLQKVAAQTSDKQAAATAQKGLAGLPPRVNLHPAEPGDKSAAAAVADLDHSGVVVASQAASTAPAPANTELRYFRKEDAAGAQQMVGRLAARAFGRSCATCRSRRAGAPCGPAPSIW